MVQKTAKEWFFLNTNLVGLKNKRTFVLKVNGRFFGAVPFVPSPNHPPIIYSSRAQERIIFFTRVAVNPPFILTFAVCNQNDGGAQMTNTIRPIPYGVADFLSLRERNMYFQHLLLPAARRVHPGLPGGLSRRDGGGVSALRRVDL